MTRTDVPPNLNAIPPRILRLGRTTVFGLLFAVFDLAFILSPYWQAAPHFWQVVMFLGILPLGLGWAALAAGDVEIRVSKRSLWLLACSILMLAYLSRLALMQSIAFRGDEDWHLARSIQLLEFFVSKYRLAGLGLLFLELAFLGLVRLARNLSWRRIVAACLILAGIQAAILAAVNGPHGVVQNWDRLARYPFVETWLTVVPALAASLAFKMTPPFHSSYCEAVWRIVPFLSAALLAWLVGAKIPARRPFVRLLTVLAVGTVPLVFYYDSILYLEMPAVLLMSVVCFDAADLLGASSEDLRRRPAWYALLAIGFCKETVLPFLLAFALCRIALRLRKWEGFRRLEAELAAVFLPIALFMLFHWMVRTRSFAADWGQLWVWRNYRLLGRSYIEQFGPLGLLSALGIGVMLARRNYSALLFFSATFFGDALLHLLDEPSFRGYSRFNLFLLPMLLVTAWQAIESLAGLFSPMAWMALGLVIFGNLFFFCPIHPDGSRVALWGDDYGGFDTTDHTYPYREAIRWINDKNPPPKVLFAGKRYEYGVDFYVRKRLDFKNPPEKKADRRKNKSLGQDEEQDDPSAASMAAAQVGSTPSIYDEAKYLERALQEGQDGGFDAVVYHLHGLTEPRLRSNAMHGYMKNPKTFENESHKLLVFEKRKKRPSSEPSPPPDDDDAPEPGSRP